MELEAPRNMETSMTTAQIEDQLRKKEVEYSRSPKGYLVLPIEGERGAIHPLLLSDEPGGYIRVFIRFPYHDRSRRIGRFCKTVAHHMPAGVQIGLNTWDHSITLSMHMLGIETLGHCTNTLRKVCDALQPLCLHLCEHQRWDKRLVTLAFDPVDGHA